MYGKFLEIKCLISKNVPGLLCFVVMIVVVVDALLLSTNAVDLNQDGY